MDAVGDHFQVPPGRLRVAASAFRHGVSEQAIVAVVYGARAMVRIGDDPTKLLMVGFDQGGVLLEVIGQIDDDGAMMVFHAMKCRKVYLGLLEGGNK